MCIPFPNPAVQKAFLPSLNKAFTKAQRCAKKKWEKKKENQHSKPNIYSCWKRRFAEHEKHLLTPKQVHCNCQLKYLVSNLKPLTACIIRTEARNSLLMSRSFTSVISCCHFLHPISPLLHVSS